MIYCPKPERCSRPHGRFSEMRHYWRSRLHRKLFLIMGFAIFATCGAAILIFHVTSEKSPWEQELEAIERFFSGQFAQVWHDQEKRNELAEEAADAFRAGISLSSTEGAQLGRYGSECRGPRWTFPVRQDGATLGLVEVCPGVHAGPGRTQALLGLVAAGFVLWLIAGVLAHRLGRPLVALADVTREIGEGRLSSRARLGRQYQGELGTLAHSINEMAERIERQMRGQRELLAGVSHEIRTPLARLRVLTEILRDRQVDEKSLSYMEEEIAEIDDLTGQLLANSRLEFESLDETEVDVVALAQNTLRRVGISEQKLTVEGPTKQTAGDATLLARALVNLLQNAQSHGGGLVELRIAFRESHIAFSARDAGPGFAADVLPHAFDSFFRGSADGKGKSSLGLGLALVQRIAHAHQGTVGARNLSEGGAEVSFSVRLRSLVPPSVPPKSKDQ